MTDKMVEKNIIEKTISGYISSNATSIRSYAFQGCTSLTSVSLPNATSIDFNAFAGCSSLTSVSIPNATIIDGSAFSSVSDLYLEATTQITIGLSAVPSSCKIHLGTPITSITLAVTPLGYTGYYVFAHSANDPVYLDMTSWPKQGSDSKNTCTYYIYTDNATIKDGCLAKANEYTTINVYKLDGSSW